MALASQQQIPSKPEVKEPWTFKKLFPFSGAVTTLGKVFVNLFDLLLAYMVIVLGVAQLIGKEVSGFFWGLTVLILVADMFERMMNIPEIKYQKSKNKK